MKPWLKAKVTTTQPSEIQHPAMDLQWALYFIELLSETSVRLFSARLRGVHSLLEIYSLLTESCHATSALSKTAN